ncbi:tumor necrosis factor ligand superfamily member 6 [Acipenser ruthenus]|uniref:tumor necrosis factor ligand superfamily member 6 n=1 Tax=Acipenser ruthenus TaxID=7906 RepID=UPI002740E6A5|nr:tumor necrosis factor ligand superfamily member 6 [Acipenser ruthenus]
MQQNLSYVYPQIFLVDRGGLGGSGGSGAPGPETTALPAWPVLPPQLKQGRGGRGGCTALLLALLLLTMAGLGLGAYYILRLQQELTELRQDSTSTSSRNLTPVLEKQIGLAVEEKETKRMAHLTVKSANGRSETLLWEPVVGKAFTEGMEYRDGALLINETGQYFLYSRLLLRGTTCPRDRAIVHRVFKRSGRYPAPISLLEDRKLSYCSGERMWTSSSYLAAVMQLQKFDRVSVNVSEPQLVSLEPANTYFGIYKI